MGVQISAAIRFVLLKVKYRNSTPLHLLIILQDLRILQEQPRTRQTQQYSAPENLQVKKWLVSCMTSFVEMEDS